MKVGALAKSAIKVLDRLVREGPLSPNEIATRSKLASRTVAHALLQLRKYELCKRRPNLLDMRKPLYYADIDRLFEFEIDIDRLRVEQRLYFRI